MALCGVPSGTMVDDWTTAMTARERVQSIAETIPEPRTPNWVAEQAEVKWDTAKKHLEDLVEQGLVLKTDEGRYYSDPSRAYFDHLRDLIIENDKDRLREELAAIAEEIEGWREEYDVETLDELETSLGDDSLTVEEIHDRRRVARQWEENQQYRDLFTTALSLYDDVTELFSLRSTRRVGVEEAG